MQAKNQNGRRTKNENAMLKFIVAIWKEKIQWFSGVHLDCQIGGYATSLTRNGSAEVNKTILQRCRSYMPTMCDDEDLFLCPSSLGVRKLLLEPWSRLELNP
jgi:hypothetical protein